MVKNQQSKEQQDLKALNKTIFQHSRHKFKIILSENNDGSFNLQFRMLKKPKSLLPHLEPNMNVCYADLEERNIRNIDDYYECKKGVVKIIESWKSFNIDEIVCEADRYLKFPEYNHKKEKIITFVSIDNDLKVGLHNLELIECKKTNKVLLIKTNDNNKEQVYKIAIVEISGQEFIDLGYIDYDKLKNITIIKANKEGLKSKRLILRIRTKHTYNFFYFHKEKQYYKIIDNCKISSKNSRISSNSSLFKKKIMIIGLGAIGSHVAELIASFWPKVMVIWDSDLNLANSATRQNYSVFSKPLLKTSLLKKRLSKYKGIDIITKNYNFQETNTNKMSETFDYILDCTGKSIIASEFVEISKYAKDQTIIAAAYIQKNLFIKICNFKILRQESPEKKWHSYDIANNKKNKPKLIIKGCSQVLEYSYLNVYHITTNFVSSILKFKGKGYEFKEINSLG